MDRLRIGHGLRYVLSCNRRLAEFLLKRGADQAEFLVAGLLQEFQQLRFKNLRYVIGLKLSEEDLDRTGTHPELGAVTLRHLLSMWVVHDLGHLVQIARTMAKRYGDDVGPWRTYTRVLED